MMFQMPMVALVKRELVASMRQPRMFGLLALFVFAAAAVVIAQWPTGTQLASQGAMQSWILLNMFSWTLTLGAFIFVPPLTSSAFLLEKKNDTLDMLSLTLISPPGMVLAKMLNAVGLLLFVFVATLPIIGSVFFLVGLEWIQVAGMLWNLLLSTAAMALVGLYCSLRFRHAVAAAIASYVIIFFTHKVLAGIMLIIPVRMGMMMGIGMGGPAVYDVLFWVFFLMRKGIIVMIALFFLVAACRRLHLATEAHSVSREKPIDDPGRLSQRRRSFPFYLIDPLRRKKPIEDGRNPMLVKELRWGLAQNGTTMTRVFYGTLVVFGLFAFPAVMSALEGHRFSRHAEDAIQIAMVAQVALAALITPLLVAGVITKEREQGNLDMLRMTLIRPKAIIIGKGAAGAIALMPIITATLLVTLGLLFLFGFSLRFVPLLFMGVTTTLVSSFFLLSLSLFASEFSKHTTSAITSTYLFGVLLYGAAPILLTMLVGGSDELFMFMSPVFSLVRAIESDHTELWLAIMLAYFVIACLLLWATTRHFIKYRMRD